MWFCYSTGFGRARGLHVALCLLLQSRILSERENLKLEINFYSFILEAMRQRKKLNTIKREGREWAKCEAQSQRPKAHTRARSKNRRRMGWWRIIRWPWCCVLFPSLFIASAALLLRAFLAACGLFRYSSRFSFQISTRISSGLSRSLAHTWQLECN